MEERRDEHSHGKEELIPQEKWRDRQTKEKEKRLIRRSTHLYQHFKNRGRLLHIGRLSLLSQELNASLPPHGK